MHGESFLNCFSKRYCQWIKYQNASIRVSVYMHMILIKVDLAFKIKSVFPQENLYVSWAFLLRFLCLSFSIFFSCHSTFFQVFRLICISFFSQWHQLFYNYPENTCSTMTKHRHSQPYQILGVLPLAFERPLQGWNWELGRWFLVPDRDK